MSASRWFSLVAAVALAVTLGSAERSGASSIRHTIDDPKACPTGLTLKTKAVKGGMVDFVVMDAEQIAHAGDLYKGRVGAVAYLEIATSEQKIGSVSVRGEKDGENTRYTFRLSQSAVKASELQIALNLFEKDGSATVGGGVSMQIRLAGFQPQDAAAAAK